MKKFLPLASLIILAAFSVFLLIVYGCGSNPTGGGSSADISTEGAEAMGGCNIITISHSTILGMGATSSKTITGKVREIVSGNPIANVLVMAPSSTTGYVSTETGSNGSYSLSGVKTGTIGVTIVHNDYHALSIACDADEVYFNLFPRNQVSSLSKDCTLEAYIYRSDNSPASSNAGINLVCIKDSLIAGYGDSVSQGHHSQATVISGTTVYFLGTETDIGSSSLMSASLDPAEIKTVAITLEAEVGTVRATLIPPTSFGSIYNSSTDLATKIPNSYCWLQVNQGLNESGTTYRVKAPPGNYKFIAGCNTNECLSFYQEKINSLSNGITIEMGSINLMECPTLSPPDTGTPTPVLSFSSVEAADLYLVQVWEEGVVGTGWMGITSSTSIEFPPIPSSYDQSIKTGTTYVYYLYAYKFPEDVNVNNFDFAEVLDGDQRHTSKNETTFTTSF